MKNNYGRSSSSGGGSNNNNNNNTNNNGNNNNGNEDFIDLTTDERQLTVKIERSPLGQECSDITEWLVEDSLSEETLVALGIDISEIRAQREIEQRLEQEVKQQKFAEQLQEAFNREHSAMGRRESATVAESSTSSTSTTSTIESVRIASVSHNSNNRNQIGWRPVDTPANDLSYSSLNSGSSSSSVSNNVNNYNSQVSHPVVPSSANTATNAKRPATPTLINPKRQRPDVARSSHYDSDEEISNSSDQGPSNRTGPRNSGYERIQGRVNMTNNQHTRHTIIPRNDIIRGSNHATSGTTTYSSISSSSSNSNNNNNNNHNDMRPLTRIIPNGQSSTTSTTSLLGLQLSATVSRSTMKKKAPVQNVSTEDMDKWMDGSTDINIKTKIPKNALDDLEITLMKHQQTGFKWMYQQEKSSNKGGLLCDDMGLGKTIQSLAIIVSRRCLNPDPLPNPIPRLTLGSSSIDPILSKATLIVCPVNLMSQWTQEVKSKTKNLTIYLHHGTKRSRNPYDIAPYDIVITSYNTLASEASVPLGRTFPDFNDGIFSVIFHRVILDEAHLVKNPNSNLSNACTRLKATHRWCLTATPIQSKLDDLYALVSFLKIAPYCDYSTFRNEIAFPLVGTDTDEKNRARKLFSSFALRRTKKATIGGQVGVKLPKRDVHVTYVNFTPAEQEIYDSANNKILSEIKGYVRNNTVMRNYTTLLVHLLRLRQLCLHPALLQSQRRFMPTPESGQIKLARALGKNVVTRLLAKKNDLNTIECPICMDIAEQPQIISGCGHIFCDNCLETYIRSSNNYSHGTKSCPECRGVLRSENIVAVDVFLKLHGDTNSSNTPLSNNVTELAKKTGSSKITTMLKLLEKTRKESGGLDKTIIFSQFTSMIDSVGKALSAANIKYQRYDGQVVVAKRGKILSDFESDPSIQVLVISTKCGSVGLNMTMANRVIMMDVGWNPLLENQAIDRVHRIGQTKDVEVHRLVVRNSVEERLMILQEKKQAMADNVLDGGSKQNGGQLPKLGVNEMLYLFCNVPLPDTVVAGPSR